MEYLGEALGHLHLESFAYLLAGILMGAVLGAIPGLSATMGVVLILPFTFYLDMVPAVLLLAGAYKGSYVGGSLPSILLGAPGTAAAVATTFDGYAMAQKGQAGKALSMARIASVFGDTFSDLVLLLIIGPLSMLALLFGSPEYAALIAFALVFIGVATAVDGAYVKSLLALALGMLVATVGLDPFTGATRFMFGNINLLDGLDMRAVLVGLFAFCEVLYQLVRRSPEGARQALHVRTGNPDDDRVTWTDFKKCFRTLIRSSVIGTLLGALPGIGPSIASYVGYIQAKRASKNPEEFGKGSVEGVAAAECADNATSGANLIPLLTLGIPGDVAAALIGTAFIIHGLTPGPNLLREHGGLVYAIILGLLLGNVILFGASIWLIKYLARLVQVRASLLFPVVFVCCVVGTYATTRSLFAVYTMLGAGLVGFGLRWFGFSRASFVLGLILGPLLEVYVRRSLLLSGGSLSIFWQRPLALVFLLVAGGILALTAARGIRELMRIRRRHTGELAAIPQGTTGTR